MTEQSYGVSMAFARGPQNNTITTGNNVLSKLYNVAAFAEPPVTSEDLGASIALLNEAITAQAQGGTEATSIKNVRLKHLRNQLKKLALYVEEKAFNDLTLLLSSGFQPKSKNRASEQLPAPTNISAKNGLSGQAIVMVKAVANSRSYIGEYALLDEANAPGPWQDGGVHTAATKIAIGGLVPGKMYIFRARAVGGLTGLSDWSEITSLRVM